MGWGSAVVRIVLGLLAVLAPVVAVDWGLSGLGVGFLARSFLGSVTAVVGYVAFVRLVVRRPVVELGVELTAELGVVGAIAEICAGAALGAALFTLVIGSIWLAGGVEFAGWNVRPDLSYALGLAVFAGVVEEIAARGVVFRVLEMWLGSWGALALSAALFGAAHLVNPGASVFAAVAIALEAGVMLGAAFMVTRRLYLAMGLHFAWNFVQAGVFGGAVSGIEVGGLMMTSATGPDWISGGSFGAEASVLAVVWCGVLGAVLVQLAARRGRVIARAT